MTDEQKQSALSWLRRKYPTEWQASEVQIAEAKHIAEETRRVFQARFSDKKSLESSE